MNEKKESNDSESIRLQLAIARAGVASRRHAEEMIRDGLVRVNGKIITEMGTRVNPSTDKIEVEGRALPAAPRRHWTVMLNKPVGVLSSMEDPFGGRTVADLVRGQVSERVVPVGRLDKDSEGLLLMSNDGDLVLKLTHPRYEHEKTYVVDAAGRWSEDKLRLLRSRVKMPDGYEIRPVPVKVLETRPDNTARLEFRLHEGRKRQIRYMCSAAHLVVLRLKRVAVGSRPLDPKLAPGAWRDRTKEELDGLVR